MLACYEKERGEACVQKSLHITKKQSTGADTGSRKAVDRGGHGQPEGTGQSTGADTGSRRAVDRGGHGQSEGSRPRR